MDGCQNGGKCTYFGNCECAHGYVGYDCGVQMGMWKIKIGIYFVSLSSSNKQI